MLSKVKLYATAILGMLTAIIYGLLQREKKNQAEYRVIRAEVAREYERAGSEALISGLENEQKVKNETVIDPDRTHFN